MSTEVNTDAQVTPVIFRMFHDSVTALFPTLAAGSTYGDCTSYAHIGQHGAADYQFVVAHSRLATPEEYADLLEELTKMVGYEVEVYSRQTPQMHEQRMQQHDEWARARRS